MCTLQAFISMMGVAQLEMEVRYLFLILVETTINTALALENTRLQLTH